MVISASKPETKDAVLSNAIAEYLNRVDAGEQPDVREFYRRFPDLCDELSSFFEAGERFASLVSPLNSLSPGTTQPIALPAFLRDPSEQEPTQFGDYRMFEPVARGGMGVVVRAHQISLDRTVALKFILSGPIKNTDEISRFRREACMAAQLDHPFIVPIYEVGQCHEHPYISMRYFERGSLAQLIDGYCRNTDATVRLVIHVANTIQFAHEHGLLHLDLKPGNVLLDGAGFPHIADFGLARSMRTTSHEQRQGTDGLAAGTPAYMAPEQILGERDLTPSTDVYGLGVLLFELLAGRHPFVATTSTQIMLAILQQPAPNARSINANVSRDLEAICRRCLAKSPSERYSSAGDVANDLERALSGVPVLARRIGSAERAWKWARRNPSRAGLAIVGTLAVAAMIGSWTIAAQYRDLQVAYAEVDRLRQSEAAQRARIDSLLTQTQNLLYLQHVGAAERFLEEGRADLAADQLAACKQDRRNWEWYYLSRFTQQWQESPTIQPTPLVELGRHSSAVTCVRWAQDGKLCSAGRDGFVRVWDVQLKKLHSELFVGGEVEHLALIGRPPRIAVVRSDGTASLYASRSATPVEIPSRDPISCIEILDDDHIVTGSTNGIALWSREGQLVASSSAGNNVKHVIYSATRRRILSVADGSLTEHDCEKLQHVVSYAIGPMVSDGTMSRPNHYLAVGRADGGISLFSLFTTPSSVAGLAETKRGKCRALSFSPDETRLASATADGSVSVYDPFLTGQLVLKLRRPVLDIAFDGSGGWLAFGDEDGLVGMWDGSQDD